LEKAKANLSKAEKKKLEKLIKERKEISEKQAELARKQAEIARQQAEITGEKGKVFYFGTSTYTENPSNSFSFKSMDDKAFKNGITIKGIGI
jgi:coenzyme F420-reducing hydrogenase alpha subunit